MKRAAGASLREVSRNLNIDSVTLRRFIQKSRVKADNHNGCSLLTDIVSSLQRDESMLNSKTLSFFNGKLISPKINLKCNVFKFRTLELNEIASALRSIKVSKSEGPDNLPAQLIRDGGRQIAVILYFLANQSLRSGLCSNSEKRTRLTLIHKSGEKSNFDNYRSISVSNILAKVLEKLMH